MSSSQALYNRLFDYLRTVHPDPHVKRISNWVWIMVGMILSHSVQLNQIANHIPSKAKAAGRITLIRRWLSNRFVNPIEFYRPLIQSVLTDWAGQAVYVILDATSVNHGKLQVLRLSLSHCFRALPLSWLVSAGTGLVSLEQALPLLREALRLLSDVGCVNFLADRGFRSTAWAHYCLSIGWIYLIRVANNTRLTLHDGRQLAIEALGVTPGQRRYFYNVRLTQDGDLCCNLMVTWTRATAQQPAELVAVITPLRPCYQSLQEYLIRMHIEESFRDDKSGSVDLAQTHLCDAERLNHLLLALAVVTLWVHAIGLQVVTRGQRKEIDPAAKRQLCIFQIGWRKLQRLISHGIIPLFQLRIRPMRLAPLYNPLL
jgi:hypothetical protein